MIKSFQSVDFEWLFHSRMLEKKKKPNSQLQSAVVLFLLPTDTLERLGSHHDHFWIAREYSVMDDLPVTDPPIADLIQTVLKANKEHQYALRAYVGRLETDIQALDKLLVSMTLS
jgi:hypothetical protein